MSEPRANIELKIRYGDLDRARAAALTLGARPAAIEQQRDTYFNVPHGRLKLREVPGETALLIAYQRPDQAVSRRSEYYLVPAPEPHLLKAALTAALGVRGEVTKEREILLWQNVRIHLDRVDGLGALVEFEAVLGDGETESAGHERIAQLLAAMGVSTAEHLAGSYADLLGI